VAGSYAAFTHPTYQSARRVSTIVGQVVGAGFDDIALAMRFLPLAAKSFAYHGMEGVESCVLWCRHEGFDPQEIRKLQHVLVWLEVGHDEGLQFGGEFDAFLDQVAEGLVAEVLR